MATEKQSSHNQSREIHIILAEEELVSISKRLLLAIRKSDNARSPTCVSSNNQEEQLLWLEIREQQQRLQFHVNLKSLRQMSENGKKAFWINIYNSFLQLNLREHYKKHPQQDRSDGAGVEIATATSCHALLYTTRNIPMAGRMFSLDDIEHGILRKYRWKFLYGYVPHLPMLVGPISKLAVQKLDCRIHFALNCGAKSCPPIAYYSADKIEAQLDQATRAFLCQETEIAHVKHEIHLSKIFYWYYGDFGGKKGIHDLLTKYSVDSSPTRDGEPSCRDTAAAEDGKLVSSCKTDIRDFRLIYKGFSWEQNLDNYAFDPDNTGSSSHSIHR
jgi:hypothetical protein